MDSVSNTEYGVHSDAACSRKDGIDEQLGRHPLPVISEPACERRAEASGRSIQPKGAGGDDGIATLDNYREGYPRFPFNQLPEPRRRQCRIGQDLAL
jgi:hypothetical protein